MFLDSSNDDTDDFREESESSEPVQLFWRADKQAIHQLDDDGTQTKSFSFGELIFSGS